MQIQTIFSRNLKKYRKKAKLTQEKLAEMCSTDHRYIGQIETGTRCPSLEFVGKIADALKIAPFLLFFDENADSPLPLFPTDEMQRLYQSVLKNIEQVVGEVVEKAVSRQFMVNQKKQTKKR